MPVAAGQAAGGLSFATTAEYGVWIPGVGGNNAARGSFLRAPNTLAARRLSVIDVQNDKVPRVDRSHRLRQVERRTEFTLSFLPVDATQYLIVQHPDCARLHLGDPIDVVAIFLAEAKNQRAGFTHAQSVSRQFLPVQLFFYGWARSLPDRKNKGSKRSTLPVAWNVELPESLHC
jgi:hypothetical protein